MSVSDAVKEAAAEFDVSDDQLKQYMDKFLDAVTKGLGKSTHDAAIVKCFVTYVQDLPTGKEEGKYLAIDVGGSNFRVLLAELAGGSCSTQFKSYTLPQSAFTSSCDEFFDLLAQYIAEGCAEFGVAMDNLPLGITFSFPLMQKGLKVGVLERWTKSFNIAGVVGTDVVSHLNKALEKRDDLKVNVVAILNDTTGTLVSCAFDNPNCKVGLILGTGTNACYEETQANAELFDEPDNGSGHVLINTEWGAFGDDGALDFVRLDYDKEVDKSSINPGRQLHEKMISGLYLGEIVRLALKKYTKKGIIFTKKCTCPLSQSGVFKTKYLSFIEGEADGTFTECRKLLKDIGVPSMTDDDCAAVKHVCGQASKRAAYLVSAGLAVLINKIQIPDVAVGIDGAFYKKHPKVSKHMEEKMTQLVDPNLKFTLTYADDGSGKGAALVAAVARKE